MKLNALHLFIILLGTLILCCLLGKPQREGMTSNSFMKKVKNNLNLSNQDNNNLGPGGMQKNDNQGSSSGISPHDRPAPQAYVNGNGYDDSSSTQHKRGRKGPQQQQQTSSQQNNKNNKSNDYDDQPNPRHPTQPNGGQSNGGQSNGGHGGQPIPSPPNYQSPNTYIGPKGNQYGTYSGVSSTQIPSGDEDLYILKSEVVPPVCPACPTNSSCPRQEPPPPCPPCARCPEPSFDCKKVPNYKSNSDTLPRPVLADFSQFGM